MTSQRIRFIQPEGFAPPRGYANGVVTTGPTLYIGGQIGWEKDQTFTTDDFIEQFGKALDHVLAVLVAAGGAPTDLCQMTVYVTDLDAYRTRYKELGSIWRERLGKHFPAMALVGVTGLVHPSAKVEIEAVASLPAMPGVEIEAVASLPAMPGEERT